MLLLLRRLKHNLFMKSEFRRYLAYAVGELMLVIIGILIALQIDNWNEDRKERATLQTYVEGIARNMREDLAEIEPLAEYRLSALHANSQFDTLLYKDRFDVDEIFFLSQVLRFNTTQRSFSPNTSGYDALKVSGVLGRLQGRGMDQLLSRYYDTVDHITRLENDMLETIRPIVTELRRERGSVVEGYAIINPSALTPARFEAVQPFYARFVNNPNMNALISAQYVSQSLLLNYASLQVLGQAFIRAVEGGQLRSTEGEIRTAADDFDAGRGIADVIVQGRPNTSAFWHRISASASGTVPLRFDSVQLEEGKLKLQFSGGREWISFYMTVINRNTSLGRDHADFSRFGRIELEMKGNEGGEVINVHVKDADYPDDQAPIGVDITLTDEWQTFEIALADLAPTDFSRLHIPLGFLVTPADEPVTFTVRSARYR